MIVDTSALLAVLFGEPERTSFLEAIERAPSVGISVANFLESSTVVESRLRGEGVRLLDLFLAEAALELVPVDAEQAYAARNAFRRFGKGLHPASLNFGDCFAYALSKTRGEPLLFKGEDFSQTDILAWKEPNF